MKSAKTVMVFESLEHIMIDVLPGVPLPAPVADFIFSRVEWIRQGERGVFESEAPASWDLHDLCTLAFLVATKDTSAAGVMVSNLLRPPSRLLPSATLVNGNNNYKKSNPFRRRRKLKRGGCGFGHQVDDSLKVIIFS